MSDVYRIVTPEGALVPIVLSVAHCGVEFPEELRSEM